MPLTLASRAIGRSSQKCRYVVNILGSVPLGSKYPSTQTQTLTL